MFSNTVAPQMKKGRDPLQDPAFSRSGCCCGSTFAPSLVELLFFGRARQRLDAGVSALDDGGDFVEVTGTHFLLVRHKGVALVACGKFLLLHHVDVVLHAFAAGVGVGKLEGVEPEEPLRNSFIDNTLRSLFCRISLQPNGFPTGHQNYLHIGSKRASSKSPSIS
jgi:hypothetical protein